MVSCGTREKPAANGDIDTVRYQLATEDSVEKDAPQHLVETVDFDGRKFEITVDRTPCDTIEKVVDENGPYYDNVVRVQISSDGNPIVDRTFTKNAFRAAGGSLSYSKLTLGGMNFTAINGSGIQFNAQLCAPGSLEGGHNFKVLYNLSGGNLRITADNTEEDRSDEENSEVE